jgi:hypothetical protein
MQITRLSKNSKQFLGKLSHYQQINYLNFWSPWFLSQKQKSKTC